VNRPCLASTHITGVLPDPAEPSFVPLVGTLAAFAYASYVWIRGGDSEAQKDAFFVGGLVGIGLGILIYGAVLFADLY
jgi:hypothetical protein